MNFKKKKGRYILILLLLTLVFFYVNKLTNTVSLQEDEFTISDEKEVKTLQTSLDSIAILSSINNEQLQDSLNAINMKLNQAILETEEDTVSLSNKLKNEVSKRTSKITEPEVTDKRTSKTIYGKILKNKKKKVIKNNIIRNSIWNADVVNIEDIEDVSLFTFDESDKIDSLLNEKIKDEFKKKNYFITDQIIFSDQIIPEIAINLQLKNVDYFEGNLKKHTDYICVAIASYAYSQNKFRNDFTDCNMTVVYYIYSSETGETFLSEKEIFTGSAQNIKTSKKLAVANFVL
ncbi:MAG: hypothetical protein P8L28_09580 [Flavobacteriaceae bacterium]|nr:hypothetical protein [Flavobacteriaceae bacterium]